MHIAIVSPFPPTITGIGQYGYHVTRAISESKTFSRVTILAGADRDRRIASEVESTEVDYCWQPGQLNALPAILSRVKRLRPDLVWFNLGASAFGRSPLSNVLGMSAPFCARRLGIPTIVTLHEVIALADLRALNAPGGIFAPLGARLLTKIATQADVVCLTMGHYAKWLAARGVDCVHIPIGAYHPPQFLAEGAEQEILFFTTLAPFKGLEVLLDAFTALQTEFPHLRLTIAGTAHTRFPHYADNLKQQFNGAQNVRWLGEVAEENVMELFRNAQIVALPYTASTGSSSVLYQAATWGRAVIASDLTENKKLARESNLQIEFFQNGDAKSLQAALRNLLASPERRQSQARQNFNAIQKFGPAQTCAHYLEAFNRALEKHKSPKRIQVARQEADFT
ncbi:MAG: glycosyltransferase [Chloroflexi bacterium]|nr:glycosyltransferase [Chloroflexota bacterium]